MAFFLQKKIPVFPGLNLGNDVVSNCSPADSRNNP